MSYWVGKPLVSLVVRVHSIMGKWNLRVFETTDGPLKKKKIYYTNSRGRIHKHTHTAGSCWLL